MSSLRTRLRPDRRKRSLIGLLVVFLLGIETYRRTVGYWFVATDSLALIERSRVRSMADLVGIFTRPLMHGSGFTDVALFYRPLSSLSYALEYPLWGLSPGGYHLTNVVLHALAAVLVALTVREMTTRPVVGYLTGALFAVHPLAVDVVPAISRRQDILVTIFVLGTLFCFVRDRRTDRRWLFGGACVAYALALGSKETALVVPGLLFTWVVVHRDADEWRPRITAALASMVPFVGITLVYAVIRVGVLGGFGGYRAGVGPEPTDTWMFVPVKYLLWIAQPTDIVRATLDGLSRPVLVGIVVGIVAIGFGFVRWARSRHRFGRGQLAVLSVSGASFGMLVGIVVFATPLEALVPMDAIESASVVQYLVGSLFVGGCLAGVSAAMLGRDSPFDTATRHRLLFFAAWVLEVPGLLVVTGAGIGNPLAIGDGIQTGYLSVVPAMAGLSLLVTVAGETALDADRSGRIRFGPNAVIAVFTALLLVSLVAASPLVHPYSGWETAGEVNERLLTNVDRIPSEGEFARLNRALTASMIDGDTPLVASSVKPLANYSVESWHRLRHPGNPTERRSDGPTWRAE